MSEMRQAQRHYSLEEYLGLAEGSNLRLEYFEGEIFAMSGGTANHNRLTKNLSRALDAAIVHGCESYINDVRVATPAGLFTYPDVFVVCGPIVYSPRDPLAATNPVVIAEVLSSSTRDYDRGQKFELYRTIPALRDYLLVDQYTLDIEHRFLVGERWEPKRYTSREASVRLVGVELQVEISAVYERVDFSPPPHDH